MGTSVKLLNLEDDGGAGTAGSHWEEDDFDNELMKGYSEGWTQTQPLSKASIGVLEDSGYTVDYDAEDSWTGSGIGTGTGGGTVIGSVNKA